MPSRDPIEAVIRNLVTLRRLSNGLARDVRMEVRALVDALLVELIQGDPTAVIRTRYRRERVERLLASLRDVAGARYPTMRSNLESALAGVGKAQALWAAAGLEDVVGEAAGVTVRLDGIGVQRFRSILRAEPFHGERMRDWFQRHERRLLERTRQQIQLGLAQDETIGDLVRRIRGTSIGGGRFRGGVLGVATREAEAIVRTATTFIANRAHIEVYSENTDIVGGVEFVATLDSRTTMICASWDGTVWSVDDPKKQVPPLHVNCRSVLVPVVDWQGLGLPKPAEGTRASAGGQVPASTTYEQWFRGQPNAVQDDIIGPGRARRFRSGEISFRDMVGRDNQIVRLDELAA